VSGETTCEDKEAKIPQREEEKVREQISSREADDTVSQLKKSRRQWKDVRTRSDDIDHCRSRGSSADSDGSSPSDDFVPTGKKLLGENRRTSTMVLGAPFSFSFLMLLSRHHRDLPMKRFKIPRMKVVLMIVTEDILCYAALLVFTPFLCLFYTYKLINYVTCNQNDTH
jgi:hypothetical protein